ncbi:hypothetical protein FRAHR75_850026 [Frankia sp. Hr75.2]|nr:hypothetical protein FRAHR75_850026 [Frankia sp. Hr75.2]
MVPQCEIVDQCLGPRPEGCWIDARARYCFLDGKLTQDPGDFELTNLNSIRHSRCLLSEQPSKAVFNEKIAALPWPAINDRRPAPHDVDRRSPKSRGSFISPEWTARPRIP